MELTLSTDELSTPLRSHIMVTGGVPLRMLQLMTTSNPSITYTGDPTLTVTCSGITLSGNGINGPSSISGGTPINCINKNKVELIRTVYPTNIVLQ